MECAACREKLHDYMEGFLSPEERAVMDDHLKACPQCRDSLADLDKTLAYVRGLEDVEPPPWLTQKTMAKVREEADRKKGLLRGLFYPLHIKLPLESVGAILIAVTALYVFHHMKLLTDRDALIGTGTTSMEEAATPVAPHVSEPVVPEGPREKGALDLRDAERKPAAKASVPEKEKEFAERREAVSSGSVGREEIRVMENKAIKRFERKTRPREGAEKTMLLEKREGPPPMDRGAADVGPPVGLAGRYAAEPEASSPRPEAPPFRKRRAERVQLTLRVKDLEHASGEIEKTAARLGGAIIARDAFESRCIITVRLGAEGLEDLIEELKSLGELEETVEEVQGPRGPVEVRIEIIKPRARP